jgi:hypothetical protein
VIGGDFNTILDQRLGGENIDREGDGNIPNKRNPDFINGEINNGFWVDPVRIIYPERKEASFVAFRGDNRIVKIDHTFI